MIDIFKKEEQKTFWNILVYFLNFVKMALTDEDITEYAETSHENASLILSMNSSTESNGSKNDRNVDDYKLFDFFEPIVDDNTKVKCKVVKCYATLNKKRKSNLRQHLKRKHLADPIVSTYLNKNTYKPRIKAKIKKSGSAKKKNIKIKISRKIVVDACVEMVTKNGRPIIAINDSGFRAILDPILAGLANTGEEVIINQQNMIKYIGEANDTIRRRITKNLKGKFISLKIDVATRFFRSILGINVQFFHNGKIVLYTLGMIELKKHHTAEYIKAKLIEVLSRYDFPLDNVYSVTTDNGSNMLKCVKQLNVCDPEAEDDYAADPSDTNFTNFDEEFENLVFGADTGDTNLSRNEMIELNQNEINVLLENFTNLNQVTNMRGTNAGSNAHECIFGISCAIHSLQLVIKDGLNNCSSAKKLIFNCAGIVRKLRTPAIRALLKERNLKIPVLEHSIRWNYTVNMVSIFF